MKGKFSPTRGCMRLVPRRAATVAVHDGGGSMAYGVLSNISEGGACLVTDRLFSFGQSLKLQISFYRREQLLETEARIVWSGESIQPLGGTTFHGVEFNGMTDPDRSNLRQLLASDDFEPMPPPPEQSEFEDLLRDLASDLDRLGWRLDDRKARW